MHFASSGEIVSLLLEAGAPLEQRCVQGMTPLYCAATERRLDVFRTLLRAGAMIEGVRSFDGEELFLFSWREYCTSPPLVHPPLTMLDILFPYHTIWRHKFGTRFDLRVHMLALPLYNFFVRSGDDLVAGGDRTE